MLQYGGAGHCARAVYGHHRAVHRPPASTPQSITSLPFPFSSPTTLSSVQFLFFDHYIQSSVPYFIFLWPLYSKFISFDLVGLCWVLFYFFDHYIQSSVQCMSRPRLMLVGIWLGLCLVLFSFSFDHYIQSSSPFISKRSKKNLDLRCVLHPACSSVKQDFLAPFCVFKCGFKGTS